MKQVQQNVNDFIKKKYGKKADELFSKYDLVSSTSFQAFVAEVYQNSAIGKDKCQLLGEFIDLLFALDGQVLSNDASPEFTAKH